MVDGSLLVVHHRHHIIAGFCVYVFVLFTLNGGVGDVSLCHAGRGAGH